MATVTRMYNPWFLSDAESVGSFCVRQVEFDSAISLLRECTGASNPPQIVIGPRGIGKSFLLRRVVAEVRRDAELSSVFLPVVFGEESYEVGTAGEFWLECLSQLADQAGQGDGDPELNRTLAGLRRISDDQTLGLRCLGAVLDFADREGKRLVLVVENLNMMFGEMTDRDAGWRLRKTLQTERRIVLLASATSRFDEMDHPDHALYDLFRVCTLRPLENDECRALWKAVSGRDAELRTIRQLQILTGGGPRLLAIVARFGSVLSFRKLMDDLQQLVDDHTEYFKSHIEVLPSKERRVYLALADLWKPATTREIAERARISTNKCSAQLNRLIERGVVRQRGGTPRRKRYYLTERLYNIYYLLRRRRGLAPLVKALVRFMQSCYAPSEIEKIVAQMRLEMDDMDEETLAVYQMAFAELSPRSQTSEVEAGVALFNRGIELSDRNELAKALLVWDEVVHTFGGSSAPVLLEVVASALANKGWVLGQLGRPADALAVSDEALRRFGGTEHPSLVKQVAKALVNRGAALADMGRLEDALTAWERVGQRFGGSEESDLLEAAAVALVNSAGALNALDRRQDALSVWDDVVRRFRESAEPALCHQVAIALVNKGAALRDAGRLDEAAATWREVADCFGTSEISDLRSQAAKALVNAGAALVELNRMEHGFSAWDEVVRRYGADSAPDLLESVGKALGNKGLVLKGLGQTGDALSVCDEIVRRFGDSESAALRHRVARALVLKGAVLSSADRAEDALAAYEQVVRRHEEDGSADLQRCRDLALLGKVDIYLNRRQYQAATSTVGLVLGDGGPKRPEVAWRAHAARAEAALATGDGTMGTQDIEKLLETLADWDSPQYEAVRALMILTIRIGPGEMIRLIEASPAKDFLLSLTTALEWELGNHPRVAVEVEEVAKDMRGKLAELKGRRAVPVS